MIRMEFNTYDDGTYYFLYITEDFRLETNGFDGLQMEARDYKVRDLGDPYTYLLNITECKDECFNENLINPFVDEVIKAVKVLCVNLDMEK